VGIIYFSVFPKFGALLLVSSRNFFLRLTDEMKFSEEIL